MGLSVVPSAVNFLLVGVPLQAGCLAAALIDEGVLVRDCTSFGLPLSIRVAVRTKEENQILVEALATCLH
jgi:threonine-phosphate decarboxylase